ncbi:MAG: hypothetical protein U1F15_03660 [Burkholderiales bacterium]
MKTLLLAAALVAWVGSAAAADTASGTFTNKDVALPIKSALAFPGKSLIDRSDVIVVAVTNADMDADLLAAYHDRRRAVDQRIKDNGIGVVFFEFRPDGNYKGYSFYFASGNGCGYCGGNMGITTTVRLAKGRLAGTLKGTDTGRAFDITMDVAVLSDDHGAPLPPDGGAPGKAYLDYHNALVKRDADALKTALSDEGRKIQAGAIKEGKGAAYLNYLAKEHPTQSVRITRGWSNGRAAVILFDGEGSVLKLTGEAILVNQGGTWRVDDELTDVVMK